MWHMLLIRRHISTSDSCYAQCNIMLLCDFMVNEQNEKSFVWFDFAISQWHIQREGEWAFASVGISPIFFPKETKLCVILRNCSVWCACRGIIIQQFVMSWMRTFYSFNLQKLVRENPNFILLVPPLPAFSFFSSLWSPATFAILFCFFSLSFHSWFFLNKMFRL